MLAKVPHRRRDKGSSFRRLIDYIAEREGVVGASLPEPSETGGNAGVATPEDRPAWAQETQRVTTGSGVSCRHNCLSLETAFAEMDAVAAQNARVKDPAYHAILSWPAGESPTDGQAFDCGLRALKALGMDGRQHVMAVHRDTDNVHLHIAANRVHPETYKAASVSRDFYKLDYAMRESELRYGWTHDEGPYAVHERDGKKVIGWRKSVKDTKGKRPTGAADMESHEDRESLFSYARGEPRQAVARALREESLDWQTLHGVLARYGLAIREKGQGLAVYDAASDKTVPVKASDMHEDLSKMRLTKRLGVYEPSAARGGAYETAYDKYLPPIRDPHERARRRRERAEAQRDLRARYEVYKQGFFCRKQDPEEARQAYALLRMRARERRAEMRRTVADAVARRAFYSVIAFETLRERERLKRRLKEERAALRADPDNRRLTFREWTQHRADSGDAAAVSRMRGQRYTEKRRAVKRQP
jgi:hypothetical protein